MLNNAKEKQTNMMQQNLFKIECETSNENPSNHSARLFLNRHAKQTNVNVIIPTEFFIERELEIEEIIKLLLAQKYCDKY